MRLTLILLLISTVCFAAGVPQTSDYRYLEVSKLADELVRLEIGNGDTLYGTIEDKVRRSLDFGASWTTVSNMLIGEGTDGIFVDSKGRVYVGLEDGTVQRGIVTNDTLEFSTVLTMGCEGSGAFWNMTQDPDDSLYVGQYAGEPNDHCAYIYRSSEGKHWTEVYHTADVNRHVHALGADPWSGNIYAGIGDLPLAKARIIRSNDHGATWDTVRVGNALCKPVSLSFTPTRRIYGSDVSAAGAALDSTNVAEWTDDDSAYTAGLRLTGDRDDLVWAMTRDADRTIFAGTVKKTNHDYGYVYSTRDSGTTWFTVKTFPTLNHWDGLKWFSDDWDSQGYGYYTITEPDGIGVDTYRFREAPLWTVGSGGEFTDIATALADFRVDAGDTLVMLAGTHTIEDDAMLVSMTVRGATQDASLYLMINGAADASGFIVGVAGVEFKDLTFRTLTEITTTGKTMIEVTDGGQPTFTRCAFRDCDANTAPGILATGTGAGTTTVTLNDCIADSCSADTDDGLSAGFMHTVDLDTLSIDGLIATNNWSNRHGGALCIESSDGPGMIKNSLFVNNRARDRAGAIYWQAPATAVTCKIWHSTFDGNETGTVAEGQIRLFQVQANLVLSHLIFSNSDSTYAISTAGWPDSVLHCNSWNTAKNNFGWNSPTCTDTIHINPSYNCTDPIETCYAAKAMECREATDSGYMGWLLYTPPPSPPPEINPALHQSDYFQNLFAVSDTVCCHSSHWDIIVPSLTYSGDWTIYPFDAKSDEADGLNIKVKRADSNNGWSETFFVPFNDAVSIHQLFNTAVDTVAVQAVFSTCAADSVLSYQFIMEGW